MTTILVVDDDRKITDMLRRTLIYEGYRVATAADGEEALAKAQSERPDLVVLDWLMPKLNGLETARMLREAGCPSIMLWTLGPNPARAWYERLGGRLLSEKPWDGNEEFGLTVTEVAYGWPDIDALC